jgi:hypothetical protein
MFRVPFLLAPLLLLAGTGWVIVWMVRTGAASMRAERVSKRDRKAITNALWRPSHYERDGITHVVVVKAAVLGSGEQRVLDQREFKAFRSDDPFWEALFADAMAEARVRVDYLNAEDRAP